MRLVPLNDQVWAVFGSWFSSYIPRPKQGIFLAENMNGQEVPLGGVCIYETDGPYTLLEHFALNPAATPKVRHAAAEAIFQAIRSHLTVTNRVGFANVSFEGGAQMLTKIGWHAQPPMELMVYVPRPAGQAPQQPLAQQAEQPTPKPADQDFDDTPKPAPPDDPDDDLDEDLPPSRKTKAGRRKRRSMA